MVFETTCCKCKDYGYSFSCPKPNQYIKSSQTPEILIIAINPGGKVGSPHEQTLEQLIKFNPAKDTGNGGFYNWYKKTSESLYNNWINADNVIAETDLYKCFSEKVDERIKDILSKNCSEYLHQQLEALSGNLKIIICNGRFVEKKMRDYYESFFSEEISHEGDLRITSSRFKIENQIGITKLDTHIIFIPFIAGHLKREQRRNIGIIIEKIIKKKELNLSKLLDL